MGQINGTFIYQGQPRNGAEAKLWQAIGFEFPPEYDDDEPEIGFQEGETITTSPTYGGDGAYRWLDVPNGEYYISCDYKDHRVWIYAAIETIAEILTENEDLLVKRDDVLIPIHIENENYVLTIVDGKVAWAPFAISSTEAIAPIYGLVQNENWQQLATFNIPANAIEVMAWVTAQGTGDAAYARILYNGAPKASCQGAGGAGAGCHWAGDGLGFEAALILQYKSDGVTTVHSIGGAYYQT